MDVLFPQVKVRLVVEDGYAFTILGEVRKAMRLAGVDPEHIAAFTREAMSGDYDHLLVTVMRTVTVL